MLSGYWSNGQGCSIETLAELIGDTPKVAFDHYGKEWGQHYQDPLWAAIGARSKNKHTESPEAPPARTTTTHGSKRAEKSPVSRTAKKGKRWAAKHHVRRQKRISR